MNAIDKMHLNRVIAQLMHTQKSFEEVYQHFCGKGVYQGFDNLPIEEQKYFNSQIFLCGLCGFWCPIETMVGEGICEECLYDEEIKGDRYEL